MANASFYRLKFETINWLTNYLGGGQPLTWWLDNESWPTF
jgi:hypothetical protein